MIMGGECSVKNIENDELQQKFQNYVKLIYDKVGEKVVKQNSKSLEKYQKKKKGFC